MKSYKTGAIANTKDNRDIQYSQVVTPLKLPSKHFTDISMLPILNQGQLGTCVAHAIATVKMYQEFKESGEIKDFSRRYLYSNARKLSTYPDNSMGVMPRDGAKVIFNKGCRDNDDQDFTSLVHSEYCFYVDDRDYTMYKSHYTTANGLQETKQGIVKEGLVTIALDYEAKFWDNVTGKLSKINKVTGSHYIVVYGYEDIGDDTIFYFRNSWGENWGDKGNGQFKWNDYEKNHRDIIVFTDVPNKLIEKAKSTNYIFSVNMKCQSKHSDVKKLQERLTKEGFYTAKVTGFFNLATRLSVINYQKSKGLIADGIVGKKTRDELNK